MTPDTLRRLDDMLALDAMPRTALIPTPSASERRHLHSTRALCARICPSWEWTLDEPAGRIEAVRHDRTSPMILELHLSPFTLRWSGTLLGLPRDVRGVRGHVQGASAVEVLLHLLVELTAPTRQTLPAQPTPGASDAR
jgi:hypothetical protein